MLIGEYKSKLGEKKRVSLPKKFRDELGENLILTRGYEQSLIIVDETLWKRIAREVMNGSFINKDIRDTSRFLVGGAKEIDIDTQGRFVIPENLIEHSEITDEVVFVGLVNWIEVWDKNKWNERLKYLKTHSEEIAQEISKMSDDQNG